MSHVSIGLIGTSTTKRSEYEFPFSRDAEDIYRLNPTLKAMFGQNPRVVISEPIGKYSEMWNAVPQGSLIEVREGNVEIRPFQALM